ncbi:MAG TPA: FAD-dependent oxidoreductase, partial [Alphaproteobacteria bacterium]|nr:FAD-dependent oxidoreductase [Alphaproteobacteria bacterium]
PRFDWKKLVRAKVKEIGRLNDIYAGLLKNNRVKFITGTATLTDSHTVKIGRKRYTAANIIIAVGGRPSHPEFEGHEHTITSDEFFDMKELPRRVLVVGGGYIACELGSILNGLGSKTTIMYRADQILRGFDDEARNYTAEEMAKKGIKFRLECQIARIEKKRDGLHVYCSKGPLMVVDQVLMAIGRKPAIDGLGLIDAGVEIARDGYIIVDEYSRTSVPHIFAIGDCTERLNLTPVAIHEAVCVIETLYNNNPTKPDHRDVATAVFSIPALAAVGLTEEEARKTSAKVQIYKARFRPLRHTMTGRDERVFMKLVVDGETGRVIGAHMLGVDAPEIIQAVAIAVKAGLTKEQFDATMAIHPTVAEELVLMRTPA